MYPREENQELALQRISQEQPQPSKLTQALVIIAFLGFIIALPTIIEKLGK